MPSDVVLSMDLDWAPEEAIAHALALVDEYELPVTLFCTHPSSVVGNRGPRTELGWHPNFLGDKDEKTALDELEGWYPGAVGERSHVLYWHSRLATSLGNRGIEYTSNQLQFLEGNLRAFRTFTGLVELPIFWEDDVHLLALGPDLHLGQLGLERPGLKVLDFHPIHLYLNTDTMDRYQAAKPDMRIPERLVKHRNPGQGDETLFRGIIEKLLSQGDAVRFCLGREAAARAPEHPGTPREER